MYKDGRGSQIMLGRASYLEVPPWGRLGAGYGRYGTLEGCRRMKGCFPVPVLTVGQRWD